MKKQHFEKWSKPGREEVLDAINIVEGAVESSPTEELKAWQYLINTGVCWELQGWYGRTASRLIESGDCHEASQR